MSEERLQFKLKFYDEILVYFESLKKAGKKLIIMGDVNTAHREIDLAAVIGRQHDNASLRHGPGEEDIVDDRWIRSEVVPVRSRLNCHEATCDRVVLRVLQCQRRRSRITI